MATSLPRAHQTGQNLTSCPRSYEADGTTDSMEVNRLGQAKWEGRPTVDFSSPHSPRSSSLTCCRSRPPLTPSGNLACPIWTSVQLQAWARESRSGTRKRGPRGRKSCVHHGFSAQAHVWHNKSPKCLTLFSKAHHMTQETPSAQQMGRRAVGAKRVEWGREKNQREKNEKETW